MNIIGFDATQVDTTAKFKVGTIAGDIGPEGPQKCYKYVKFNAGTGIPVGIAGQIAYYSAVGGYGRGEVTSDVSDSGNIAAGVIQASMANGTYGWVQISGTADMSIALTAGANGNALTAVGAGDGTLNVSGAATDAICAFVDDATVPSIVCCFPK